MTIYHDADIKNMSQRFKVNFINSLSGFKSANLIGTVSKENQTNLAIISSAFHLGAEPALLGFINRPHSVDRHTLANIINTGCYTLNHVNSDIIDAAHQTSARYTREQSEFDETGLQPHWHDDFIAPFVKASRVRIGLEYKEHHTLLNDTVLVIGEIVLVDIDSKYINEDGLVNLDKTKSIAVSGLDSYHSPQKVKRLAYAKPNLPVKTID